MSVLRWTWFLGALTGVGLSEATAPSLGLLTKDYGIVTTDDLEEDRSACDGIRPFPDRNGCFNYWQCMPSHDVRVECEDLGVIDAVSGRVGSATLKVKTETGVHRYGTRRNFDLEGCQDLVQEWRNILQSEEMVCIAGTYNGEDVAQYGREHHWTIDRLKSIRFEWSYFSRKDDLASTEEPKNDLELAPPDMNRFLKNQSRALLSDEDLFLERENRTKIPALSGGGDSTSAWESFERWLCFDLSLVSMERIEVDYEGKKKLMPQFRIFSEGHEFEVGLSAETEYDNDAIENDWRHLIRGASNICVYAAYLQGGRHSSLWILSRVKTNHGVWLEAETSSSKK